MEGRNREKKRRGALGALARRRKELEAIDGEILRLLARRMERVHTVGQIKSRHRIPLRNFEVEAEVERRLAALAAELGHGEALGRELARFLIGVSLEAQAPYLDTAYAGERLRVLVAGGAGGMGRWLCRFLSGQGHRVRVFDPSPALLPYPRVRRLATGALWADLVFLAVPMEACGPLLEELAALRPPAIVAELCSLKDHLAPVLARVRAAGLRVVSFHPMFGPETTTLAGKKILFVQGGAPEDLARVRGLFETTSAQLVEVEAAEHDRLMAWVLGLVHLHNLALARALARRAPPFSRLRAAEGVTFRRQALTTAEVAGENPHLYFAIQHLNPHFEETAGLLAQSLEELVALVTAGDGEAFAACMEESRRYFGS
ncbi:MAG: prephenate dehydrogenase/arogenate dehydrogenase family protein [Acidobacteriota bacterium]